jgi:hypothetical protein
VDSRFKLLFMLIRLRAPTSESGRSSLIGAGYWLLVEYLMEIGALVDAGRRAVVLHYACTLPESQNLDYTSDSTTNSISTLPRILQNVSQILV